jgi:8-oxo-dGTP pyrophosphatase MutT (NUDIX family)
MRQRATAIIIRDGKVLLVRDRIASEFSLPGGAMNKGEPTISAATREVYEELGLHAFRVTRLKPCDYKGSTNEHKVCFIETDGQPHMKGHELAEFIWWDMRESIPIFSHVKEILKTFEQASRTL